MPYPTRSNDGHLVACEVLGGGEGSGWMGAGREQRHEAWMAPCPRHQSASPSGCPLPGLTPWAEGWPLGQRVVPQGPLVASCSWPAPWSWQPGGFMPGATGAPHQTRIGGPAVPCCPAASRRAGGPRGHLYSPCFLTTGISVLLLSTVRFCFRKECRLQLAKWAFRQRRW